MAHQDLVPSPLRCNCRRRRARRGLDHLGAAARAARDAHGVGPLATLRAVDGDGVVRVVAHGREEAPVAREGERARALDQVARQLRSRGKKRGEEGRRGEEEGESRMAGERVVGGRKRE